MRISPIQRACNYCIKPIFMSMTAKKCLAVVSRFTSKRIRFILHSAVNMKIEFNQSYCTRLHASFENSKLVMKLPQSQFFIHLLMYAFIHNY